MQKTFSPEDFAMLFEQSADTMVDDIENDHFIEGCEVSWLTHKPKTLRSAFENVWERVRTLGVTPSVTRDEFRKSVEAATACSIVQIKDLGELGGRLILDNEWDAQFDARKIDDRSIGEAAYLRSTYRQSQNDD